MCIYFSTCIKAISYRCHYRWCGKNQNVSVRKIVPVLLMNICVQVADSVNCFSLKRLCDRLVVRPFVVHQSRAVCVQRCRPMYVSMCVVIVCRWRPFPRFHHVCDLNVFRVSHFKATSTQYEIEKRKWWNVAMRFWMGGKKRK